MTVFISATFITLCLFYQN